MRKAGWLATVVGVVVALPAWATTGLTGAWEGRIESTSPSTVLLSVKHGKGGLSGVAQVGDAQQKVELASVRQMGDAVSFTVPVDGGVLRFVGSTSRGKVSGNVEKLTQVGGEWKVAETVGTFELARATNGSPARAL